MTLNELLTRMMRPAKTSAPACTPDDDALKQSLRQLIEKLEQHTHEPQPNDKVQA